MSKKGEEAPLLAIRAEAAETDHSASTVHVGVGAEAEAVVAPPGRFEAVSLRIESGSNAESKRARLLMAERRSLEGQGETFPLRLTSRVEGPIALSAENLEAIEGKEAALLNPSTRETYDLLAQETVTVDPTGESATLKLAVGSEGYVEGQKQKVLPTEVSLTSYPNPAREQGTLEYALPEETEVTLKVYDVLGREVATLSEGQKEAGRHTVRLETSRLSSGVYFGRLQAGGQTLTQKITIVR